MNLFIDIVKRSLRWRSSCRKHSLSIVQHENMCCRGQLLNRSLHMEEEVTFLALVIFLPPVSCLMCASIPLHCCTEQYSNPVHQRAFAEMLLALVRVPPRSA